MLLFYCLPNPLLISLSLDYAKEFLCFLAAKKVYDNFNIEFIDFNKTPFYCSLLKAYQTEIDNDGKRKEYTENLCKDLLDTFKKRIEKNTWMSLSNKEKYFSSLLQSIGQCQIKEIGKMTNIHRMNLEFAVYWYNLYDVKFGDTYYLSPDQRIILW